MSRLFITCNEATAICNKNQYKEASFFEKMKLSIHLFLCKKCGMYTKQNTTLTKVCDQHLKPSDCECKFSSQEKESMQQKISDQLK